MWRRVPELLATIVAVSLSPWTAVDASTVGNVVSDTTVSHPETDSGSGSGSGYGSFVNQTRYEINQYRTLSGILPWVDPTTPDNRQSYTSSRGDTWQLVMSDEFNVVDRNFTAGKDHLWVSLDKPDGVNGGLGYYAHDMVDIKCDKSDNGSDVCYLNMKVESSVTNITVYNQYSRPPGFQNITFFYRAAMLQTWNKFCFQGGMLEVRAQLPAVVDAKYKNPDMGKGPNARTTDIDYYPTWPGIWMMGNLGRAIFSGSTRRMWPFSYNKCEPKVFDPSNQRISACDSNPGHGLNPNQGRGAPEIDLLEGGGLAISSSIQIGPGFKKKFRMIDVNETYAEGEFKYCIYNSNCATPGANNPNVPTALYKKRGYTTWYKGLRYGTNGFCAPMAKFKQTYDQINASLTRGITNNSCSIDICPASMDVQSDLSLMDGNPRKARWGINDQGTCSSIMNIYTGSYLCDPDSTDKLCETPRNSTTPKINTMESFAYQMDAISANWDVHVGAYTQFTTYQVEWVMGDTGYIRWMLSGNPLFEIPAESVVNRAQDAEKSNPQLTFPEEPMYLILNVALSAQWGSKPPNPGKACRGDGKKEKDNRICSAFPMYMKVDYVRLYQDRSKNSKMAIGCDPKTHPTRQWILDHLSDFQDDLNYAIDVDGGAPCRSDLDCMIPTNRTISFQTGTCVNKRCQCSTDYWSGPRCTTEMHLTLEATGAKAHSYGPPLALAIAFGAVAIVATMMVMIVCTHRRRVKNAEMQQKLDKMRAKMEMSESFEKTSLLAGDFDDVETQRRNSATPKTTAYQKSV
ncbi:hypothetical protein Poli38472_000382 [Pythium oligandrum]|uniref:Beta-glucan synthesis-associated protein n=1 Tax=Pythium oligandrum TaxID=41045 RepID=A0A8K1CC07_PYTOL|nr:hypothetical protein Poli38472_000382 [Pythium oligandrum]|eukprot:TMW60340.1 hypothetical protein Poli38472_000382 [Pythium oligandrum]